MQNNPKNFKKFKKTPLIFSVVFLALSSLAFIFVYGKIKENEKKSEKAQTEWQIETNRRDEIRSLERSIKEIEKERAEIEAHFAESENLVPFLDTLEKLARRAGADGDVVSVDISKEKSELVVSFRSKGSFRSTYNFIKLLENSPYELSIASFDIGKLNVPSDPEKKSTTTDWEGFFTIKLLSFTK
jgi:hypothetical protein